MHRAQCHDLDLPSRVRAIETIYRRSQGMFRGPQITYASILSSWGIIGTSPSLQRTPQAMNLVPNSTVHPPIHDICSMTRRRWTCSKGVAITLGKATTFFKTTLTIPSNLSQIAAVDLDSDSSTRDTTTGLYQVPLSITNARRERSNHRNRHLRQLDRSSRYWRRISERSTSLPRRS